MTGTPPGLLNVQPAGSALVTADCTAVGFVGKCIAYWPPVRTASRRAICCCAALPRSMAPSIANPAIGAIIANSIADTPRRSRQNCQARLALMVLLLLDQSHRLCRRDLRTVCGTTSDIHGRIAGELH